MPDSIDITEVTGIMPMHNALFDPSLDSTGITNVTNIPNVLGVGLGKVGSHR